MEDNLILYKRYLNTITELLDSYFENQKEYIHCKKGCSYCCEKGVFPFSKVEFEYLLLGLFQLEQSEREKILSRIKKIKEEAKDVTDFRHFMYRCPFLSEENVCTVYDYRGIICRTFGLMKVEGNKVVLPFCHKLGLNYSEVYDSERNMITEKKGATVLPKAYKVNLKEIKNPEMFDILPDFGETKSLIEWC